MNAVKKNLITFTNNVKKSVSAAPYPHEYSLTTPPATLAPPPPPNRYPRDYSLPPPHPTLAVPHPPPDPPPQEKLREPKMADEVLVKYAEQLEKYRDINRILSAVVSIYEDTQEVVDNLIGGDIAISYDIYEHG